MNEQEVDDFSDENWPYNYFPEDDWDVPEEDFCNFDDDDDVWWEDDENWDGWDE